MRPFVIACVLTSIVCALPIPLSTETGISTVVTPESSASPSFKTPGLSVIGEIQQPLGDEQLTSPPLTNASSALETPDASIIKPASTVIDQLRDHLIIILGAGAVLVVTSMMGILSCFGCTGSSRRDQLPAWTASEKPRPVCTERRPSPARRSYLPPPPRRASLRHIVDEEKAALFGSDEETLCGSSSDCGDSDDDGSMGDDLADFGTAVDALIRIAAAGRVTQTG